MFVCLPFFFSHIIWKETTRLSCYVKYKAIACLSTKVHRPAKVFIFFCFSRDFLLNFLKNDG
uniref:Uncharacterized protein n=1 Tax=Megaselia scalaris TaxID=36166 RepID=T1GD70_MEGSC